MRWEKRATAPQDLRVFEHVRTDEELAAGVLAPLPEARYAVADLSGTTPDRTDDGILWLVPRGSAEVYLSSLRNVLVHFDVRQERTGRLCHTGGGLHLLPLLRELGYRITLSADLAQAIAELARAGLIDSRSTGGLLQVAPDDRPTS